MDKKIAVTSMGLVTAAGMNVESNWQTLIGVPTEPEIITEVGELFSFNPKQLHTMYHGALVRVVPYSDVELGDMAGFSAKNYDRHQLFAFLAAQEAMSTIVNMNKERAGCITATGGAGLSACGTALKKLQAGKKASPRANLQYLPNLFGGYLAQQYGLKGPSHTHGTACAAGLHAIIDAVRILRLGEADAMLVVGTEAAISEFGIGTFGVQGVLGNGHAFSQDRNGFVMGEGAAALVIETEESLEKRGAEPLVWITGYGESTDGKEGTITDPDVLAGPSTIVPALEMAELLSYEIGYVNLHGTATIKGDVAEVEGLRLWMEHSFSNTPVSTVKPAIGHLLGAAGAAESVITITAMREGVIPPTWMEDPQSLDPECIGPDHVLRPRHMPIKHAVTQNFGFGGTNAAMVFEHP